MNCRKVYLARKKKTNDLYAIKVLRKDDLIEKNMISHVLTERRMLTLAQESFIVKLYYAFESRDYLFMVMEYLIGGDISSLLQARKRFTEDQAKFYLAELVSALEYLHKNGIIHRDIKPDNMLLDVDGHLKLTDFGLANFRSLTNRITNRTPGRLQGTPEYVAPEIVRGEAHGVAVDWWAVGVCLFEFLVGIPPFGGDIPEEVFHAISNFSGFDWDTFASLNISKDAQSLIDGLLDPNPDTRLGPHGVKTHPFFANVDWSALANQEAPIRPTPVNALDTSSFDARNSRYKEMGFPERSFLDAESVINDYQSGISGYSTPSRCIPPNRTASPFDGFCYKNVGLLSEINRKLSATPNSFLSPRSQSRFSSGTLSDGNFSIG